MTSLPSPFSPGIAQRPRARGGCGKAALFAFIVLSLCSGSAFGVIWFWTHLGGVFPGVTYTGQTGAITALSWSPDGTRIVSTNISGNQENGSAQIWNARNGQTILRYSALKSLNAVAWAPDGQRIAVAGRLANDSEEPPAVQIFDAATGGHVITLRFSEIDALAWSPDSKYLATAGSNGQAVGVVQIWNVSNGQVVFSEKTDQSETLAVAWSPDGKRIAAGGDSGIVKIWDALTGTHPFTYRGHLSENRSDQPGQIIALAWSPNGQWIASADQNTPPGNSDDTPDYSTVRIWQPVAGGQERVWKIDAHALAWSPDGSRIVTVNEQIRVWDALSGDHVFYYGRGFSGSTITQAVGWSPTGSSIAIGSDDGEVQIWQPPDRSAFLGHAYLYDVIKIVLVVFVLSGLCLFFSLRPVARLRRNRRRQSAMQYIQATRSNSGGLQASQANQATTRPLRSFSPRAFLFGIGILIGGAILAWGMIHYGWDIHNLAENWYTSS